MTQKQWKMISTIISIIFVVYLLFQGFWRAKGNESNQILILHRKRLKMLLIPHLRERILITLRV